MRLLTEMIAVFTFFYIETQCFQQFQMSANSLAVDFYAVFFLNGLDDNRLRFRRMIQLLQNQQRIGTGTIFLLRVRFDEFSVPVISLRAVPHGKAQLLQSLQVAPNGLALNGGVPGSENGVGDPLLRLGFFPERMQTINGYALVP